MTCHARNGESDIYCTLPDGHGGEWHKEGHPSGGSIGWPKREVVVAQDCADGARWVNTHRVMLDENRIPVRTSSFIPAGHAWIGFGDIGAIVTFKDDGTLTVTSLEPQAVPS